MWFIYALYIFLIKPANSKIGQNKLLKDSVALSIKLDKKLTEANADREIKTNHLNGNEHEKIYPKSLDS